MNARFWQARRIPLTAVGIAVLAVAVWWVGLWLASRPYFSGPLARPPVAVGGPLIATVLVSRTLIGGDVGLERSCPRFTPRFRALHALLSWSVPSAALAVTLLADPGVFGAAAVVRNTAGLVGLTLLTASMAPVHVAWVPATVVAFTSYLASGHAEGVGAAWWGWLLRPGVLDASWVVALGLLITGFITYQRRGPRR